MKNELNELLEKAKHVAMSHDEREAQRRLRQSRPRAASVIWGSRNNMIRACTGSFWPKATNAGQFARTVTLRTTLRRRTEIISKN
jgi:hypothetical protein